MFDFYFYAWDKKKKKFVNDPREVIAISALLTLIELVKITFKAP